MDVEIWNLYNEINNSFKEKDIIKNEEKKEELILNESFEKSSVKLSFFKDKKNKNICFNCKESDYLIIDYEMIVCTLCGVENDTIIDYQAEWRYYGNDDNKRSQNSITKVKKTYEDFMKIYVKSQDTLAPKSF
jgi:hypothetical protein